jgi:hypothetical protein
MEKSHISRNIPKSHISINIPKKSKNHHSKSIFMTNSEKSFSPKSTILRERPYKSINT